MLRFWRPVSYTHLIDAVLVTPSCHDPLYRRAARVSMGTVFQVPWTRIGSERDWAAEGVPLLHELGFETAALALSDDAIPLHDKRLRSCDRLALVLGTELSLIHICGSSGSGSKQESQAAVGSDFGGSAAS